MSYEDKADKEIRLFFKTVLFFAPAILFGFILVVCFVTWSWEPLKINTWTNDGRMVLTVIYLVLVMLAIPTSKKKRRF